MRSPVLHPQRQLPRTSLEEGSFPVCRCWCRVQRNRNQRQEAKADLHLPRLPAKTRQCCMFPSPPLAHFCGTRPEDGLPVLYPGLACWSALLLRDCQLYAAMPTIYSTRPPPSASPLVESNVKSASVNDSDLTFRNIFNLWQ
jgi:hypothetical protein